MRGNEFENKVQEQMEELHLRPSASVWEEVEKQLQRKKRRRVVFYLSMLAGLGLLGYSGYTFFSHDSQPITNQQQKVLSPAGQASNGNKTITTSAKHNNTTTIDQSLLKTNQPPVVTNNEKANQSASADRSIDGSKKNTLVNHKQNGNEKTGKTTYAYTPAPVKSSTTKQLTVTQTSPSIQNKISEEESVAAVADPQQNIVNTAVVKNAPEEKQPEVLIDSVRNGSAIAMTDAQEVLAPVVTIPPKGSGKKLKVKFGFDISIGRNFSRNNSFDVSNNSVRWVGYSPMLDDFYDDGLQSSSGGGNPANPTGNRPRPIQPPSAVKAGPAFKAGLTAEINLTKRSSVVAGIRYTYLSESIAVGYFRGDTVISTNSYANGVYGYGPYPFNFVSSGVNNPAVGNYRAVAGSYYGAQVNRYTNKYHFIELPLSYQLQLNKGKKFQLLWNAGISANFLITTNALVYDTAAQGIYYKRSDAFNKLHFSIQSGFSLRFGEANKMQWAIGPEFSMDMSKLMNNEVILRKRYLMYGGITARILLPRKK